MKKLTILIFLLIAAFTSVNAESTIYVLMKSMSSTYTEIAIDGKIVCDLNGPVKRTIQPYANLRYPFKTLKPCYRKIVVDGEGKIIVSMIMKYMNCCDGSLKTYKGEYPLDIEDGETYYLIMKSNGLHDIKLVEPKEKDVKKWLQKWIELPAVTVSK